MIQLQNELCDMLGIKYPIIQAGMAGGSTTPELVAEVSEFGGLGTLGAAYMDPEAIRTAVREIKSRTAEPFGVNVFSFSGPNELTFESGKVDALNQVHGKLGIDPVERVDYTWRNPVMEQVEVLFEEKVPIISTAFGVLPKELVERAKAEGVILITMVTNVEEAIEAEQAGVDIIVAQGSEAGGHRGTFDVEKYPYGSNVGTFSLIPQVSEAVNVPVVAAGGVMDGKGMVAAMVLGAKGVQMGTRFLSTKESGVPQDYKEALFTGDETSTVITKNISGRPARAIENELVRSFDEKSRFPYPFQNMATKAIRAEAKEQGNAEYLSLYAGQGVRSVIEEESVKEVLEQVVVQAQKLTFRQS
ncbi:NAD(P)H-dependent flavin oxidoreductase [Piscibacillus halophilus]|uniref:Probable nitronate monooxygenase n=1 Tax=Piscibacillus halophilus TaxID=571933 RepID=A0A1H9HQ02_9BACI|nr:nitronate monooxygenase [Piscibacillus halophilus]SEQ64421.1 nitronate monooxygenase [Piscibacillus halophilus]